MSIFWHEKRASVSVHDDWLLNHLTDLSDSTISYHDACIVEGYTSTRKRKTKRNVSRIVVTCQEIVSLALDI